MVDQLPLGTKNSYLCMFDDIEVEPQNVDSTTITCPTPPLSHVPQIQREDQQGRIEGIVALRS